MTNHSNNTVNSNSSADKRTQMLQYLNTFILTCILGFAVMIFTTLTTVKKDNVEAQKELLRIKTVQDYNSSAIVKLNDRVDDLELLRDQAIRDWVDKNYVRKPQSN
jgi:hypothetical protein